MLPVKERLHSYIRGNSNEEESNGLDCDICHTGNLISALFFYSGRLWSTQPADRIEPVRDPAVDLILYIYHYAGRDV